MGKHADSIYSQIKTRISENGEGKIYFLSDFSELDSESVRKAFVRLVNDGFIIRMAPGVFLYPRKTRFGIAYPSDYELAKEIARRDSAAVLPSGMTAANMIGLSEQVPMQSLFLTSGAARTITVNGRTIIFKRGVPKNFAYRSSVMPLVVAGMKAIGKDELTEENLSVIEKVIRKEALTNYDSLFSDTSLAPEWISKIIVPILNSIKK